MLVKQWKDLTERDQRIDNTAKRLQSLTDEDLCSVCLEILNEDNALPLPCSHFLCVNCMLTLPGMKEADVPFDGDSGIVIQIQSQKCPLCRKCMPDNFLQFMYTTAVEFIQLAFKKPRGSLERSNLCIVARKQIARINSYLSFPTENESHYTVSNKQKIGRQLRIDDVDLCLCEGKATEVILKANNLLATKLNPIIEIGLHIAIGRSYILLEDFENAKQALNTALGKVVNGSNSNEVRKISHWLCQCYYELGVYDRSIEFGESAISINRHSECVYKYVALSYKASGNLDKGIEVMKMAVAYETPWDESNKLAVKGMLDDFLEEKRNESA